MASRKRVARPPLVQEWRAVAGSDSTSGDELITMALLALQEGLDGPGARSRGAALCVAATLLKQYATHQPHRDADTYARAVAWSLSDADAYVGAALRLKCYLLPSQPSYAKARLAREAATDAATRAVLWPLDAESDDAKVHGLLLDAVGLADVDGVRRLMAPPRGYRRAAFKCAASGRTPLHYVVVGEAYSKTAAAPDANRRGDALLCAESLLGAGALAEAADDSGVTPMHLACKALWPPLVKALALASPEAALSVDDAKRTPLHYVAAALLLVPQGLAASEASDDASSRPGVRLLERRACDAAATLASFCGEGLPALACKRNVFGETPLTIAISRRSSAFVRVVVDAYGPTLAPAQRHELFEALKFAARVGAAAPLSELLAAGDVLKLLRADAAASHDLFTLAARSMRALRVLLDAGLSPDVTREAPLCLAARRGDASVCRLLLDHGASALAKAASNGAAAKKIVKALSIEVVAVLAGSNPHSGEWLAVVIPASPLPRDVAKLEWSAVALAAFYGKVDAAAVCISRHRGPKLQLLSGTEPFTVGAVSAAILGGADVSQLFEAFENQGAVSRHALRKACHCPDLGLFGCTPLLLAAALGQQDTIRTMIALGCDADAALMLERSDLQAAKRGVEKAADGVSDAERRLKRKEAKARHQKEPIEAFEERVAGARRRMVAVADLWRHCATRVPLAEASIAIYFLNEATHGATIVRACLAALGAPGDADPRRLGRKLRLAEVMLAEQSRANFEHLDFNARRLISAAAQECEAAQGAHAALGALGAWLGAVSASAEADAANTADAALASMDRVVSLRAAKDAAVELQREALSALQRTQGAPSAQARISGLAAAIAATPLRGDVRGPAPRFRQSQSRATCVSALAAAGAAVDCRDDRGDTPLALACARGYWGVACDLVGKFGADVDGGVSSPSPLQLAAAAAAKRVPRAAALVEILVSHGASCRTDAAAQALRTLSDGGCTPLVQLLVRHGSRLAPRPSTDASTGELGGPSKRTFPKDAAGAHSQYSLDVLRKAATYAFEARRIDASHIVEARLNDSAPRAEYWVSPSSEAGLQTLRVLDGNHVHRGLVLLAAITDTATETTVRLAGALLEDGSIVPLAALAVDARLYWQLQRAPAPAQHTALHCAAAAGADGQVIKALTQLCGGCGARDVQGRTALGLALRGAHRDAAEALLTILEKNDDQATWPEPDFDALFLRAAEKGLAEAERFSRAASRCDDAALTPGAGLAAARAMHAANVCVTERLSARGVAELWAPGAPPLVSAELARRSLRRIATPASAFREPHNLVVQSASDVAKLLSLAAVHELVPLVASLQVATANKAPGKKAASAAVEATLVASHAMTRGAADGTVSVAEDDEGGAVPADVLREVREFWASNAKTKTASTDPFNDFLALWRASPGKVRDALKAAKTCLGWLRCLVAARCAAMAAASAGEDVDAAFRALAELRGDEARLEDAGRAVDLMKRASLRLAGARKIATQKYDGELRSVDLVHKEAWNALVALSDGECGDFAALRREAVRGVAAVLETCDPALDGDVRGRAPAAMATGILLGLWAGDDGAAGSVPRLHGEANPVALAAAGEILNHMRAFEPPRRASAHARNILKGVAAAVAAARSRARAPALDDEHHRALDALAFWVVSAANIASAAGDGDGAPEENVLFDAVLAFGDGDAAHRVLRHLHPGDAAALAVRGEASGEATEGRTTVLAVACTRAPRLLTALLQLGADATHAEPLLRRALQGAVAEAKTFQKKPRFGLEKDAEAKTTALLILLAAAPDAALELDDSQHESSILELAATLRDAKLIHALLKAGATLAPGKLRTAPSPLHAAAALDDSRLAQRILGSVTESRGSSACRDALCRPLYDQASEEDTENEPQPMTAMLQRLAAAKSGRGDDDERRRGAYPVHLAVRQRSAAMVELCLAALRDPFSATLVQATDDSGVSPRHYRDTPLGATLLHDAAFSRAPDALRTLLRHGGFDVDLAIEYAVGRRSGPLIESVTPLEVAANRNCVRCAEELLAAGAAVEFFQVPPVALRGHAAAAGVLLAAILASEARNLGAALPLDRKYGPGGETMLHAAARSGAAQLAQLLLSSGAGLGVGDDGGASAMHYAIVAGHGAVSRLLSEYDHSYGSSARILQCSFKSLALKADVRALASIAAPA